jgi:hypothetical protein
MVTNHIAIAQAMLIRDTAAKNEYQGCGGGEMKYTATPNIDPNKRARVRTKRNMPAFWMRSHLANRCAGVPNEICSFMSKE